MGRVSRQRLVDIYVVAAIGVCVLVGAVLATISLWLTGHLR